MTRNDPVLARIAKGVGANVLDKLVVAGTQLLLMPLLAHAWGLQLYGLWVMLSTLPTLLAMSDLGLATAAGTKMAMAEARGKRATVVQLFQSAWLAILCSSVLFVLLGGFGALVFPTSWLTDNPGFTPLQARITAFALLVYGVSASQGAIVFAGFRASGQYARGALWNTVLILFETGALAAAVSLGGSPEIAAFALLSGRSLGLAGQACLLTRHAPWLRFGLGHARWTLARELMASASTVMLLPISQGCLIQGTTLALGLAAGPTAAPAFAAARTLSRIGQQLCWTINAALMPEMSAAMGRRASAAIAAMTLATLASSALLTVPFAIGFALFAPSVVERWSLGLIHAPATVVYALVVSLLAGGFWTPLSNLLVSSDRQSTFALPYAALAAAAIPLSYALARAVGAAGPAIAIAATDVVMLILMATLTDRYLASGADLLEAARRTRQEIGKRLSRTRTWPA